MPQYNIKGISHPIIGRGTPFSDEEEVKQNILE